ncbi:hypothetical protein RRF57_009055 [Xylaria bambusicola]|uniref:Uncharacterized protein n=1 Tax=Xylaria bambusicola TaxID=326684 RepID=A0AAN7UWA2_9PEZI
MARSQSSLIPVSSSLGEWVYISLPLLADNHFGVLLKLLDLLDAASQTVVVRIAIDLPQSEFPLLLLATVFCSSSIFLLEFKNAG